MVLGETPFVQIKKSSWVLFWIMVTMLFIDLFLCVVNHTALYGDGAYIFQLILEAQTFAHAESSFWFNLFLTQGFMVFALKLGFTSLQTLAYLYTFGCLIWRVLFFIAAMHICVKRGSNNFLSLTIALIVLNMITTGMFTMMTYILGTSLFYLLFLYWILCDYSKSTKRVKILVLMLSLFTTMMSPIFVLLSPILIGTVVYRVICKHFKIDILLIVNIFFYAIGMLNGLIAGIKPRDSANAQHFVSSFFQIDKHLWVILILLFVTFLASLFIENKNLWKQQNHIACRKPLKVLVTITQLMAGGACIFWVVFMSDSIVQQSYRNRIMNLITPVAFSVLIFLIVVLRLKIPEGLYQSGTVLFMLATLIFTCRYTNGYGQYLKSLATSTAEQGGFLLSEEVGVSQSIYYWGWTVPLESCYAQIFKGVTEINSIVVQNPSAISWEPFDSYNIDAFPSFANYGITYNSNILTTDSLYLSNFNPKAGAQKPFGSIGVYDNEGTMHWINREAELTLLADNKQETGGTG